MGDVAMTVPVILGLVKKYPEISITVLTKAFTAPIFLDIPNVTVLIADVNGEHKGVLGLWKLSKQLKRLEIDAVADLHNVLRSSILKQFLRFSSIPFIQLDKGRAVKKELIKRNRKNFSALKSTFVRYAEVFENLGFPITKQEMKTLSQKTFFKNETTFSGFDESELIGIAPFAAFSGKMYPLSLMENVIQELNNTDRYKIILFGGGEKEIAVLNKWEKLYTNCSNAAGKLSFANELVLISNLRLMLAMDSGNAHLASMYGVPTVTLWGVTHPYAGFYPFNQPESYGLLSDRNIFPAIPTSIYGNKYPEGYDNVMETIKPETVVQKIKEILELPIKG